MQEILASVDSDRDFYERLRRCVLKGNERMNLTRIVEPEEFLRKHVLDSLLPFLVVPALRDLPADRLVLADLGSGAGFPGLPISRLRPGWTITLLERTRKKAAFLAETVDELELRNVRVLAADAREAAPLLGRCDVVTARAVGEIAEVVRAAKGLLAPKGAIVHYKGDVGGEELEEGAAAAEKLGLVQEGPFPYALPPDAKRAVVLSRSTGRTRGAARPPKGARRRTRGGRGR
ncbi:MAG TPA: 16S rRNA (guanine(527)-N(7))-methyltransferase RsmG [Planctomycetota bacterium]|nr:16S rRNA (guanine(527)-N(7))-methyltransferase RsmG [Planctomycetota bacterium]